MCGPILNDTRVEYSDQLGGGEELPRVTAELLERPPLEERPPEREEPVVRPRVEVVLPGREAPDLD